MSVDVVKRTFQNDEGSYVLPNDNLEHDRLDHQSAAFFKVMGSTFHAPLKSPKKILDVGCGTGILTVALAKKCPDAQVIGIDIAPVPLHRHGQLPNLTYVQGDIAEIAGRDVDNGCTFALGTFDHIFARMLIFAITDWPAHVRRLVGLLSPGGWLEMQEFDYEIHAGPNREDFVDGTNMAAHWDWHKDFVRDCAAGRLDIFCGKNLVRWSEAARAVNVHDRIFHFPPGGPRNVDESGKAYWDKTRLTQEALLDKICSRQNPPIVVAKVKRDMWSTFGHLRDGDWAALHVVTAQAKSLDISGK